MAKKDAQAFRALYDSTSSKLFGFALRILTKRELAEEVLQESFVSVWNNAGSYQASLAAPMTWMTTIVRNKAFDLLRRVDHAVEIDAETFEKDVMDAMDEQLMREQNEDIATNWRQSLQETIGGSGPVQTILRGLP